ncbi:MAG: DUF4982 domain-containing protein [Bacteroidales bacterium]|nr:DUF4982 domain-containing protein [Bacteroidales bacterium]
MKKTRLILSLMLSLCTMPAVAEDYTTETILKDWQFRRDHQADAASGWQNVTVPHDWAIYGPFNRSNDLQEVAVVQNGETEASWKTGRSGGLPYMGQGCYRTCLEIQREEGRRYILLFDGAMSEARVFVNGEKVGEWPYGYNSFWCDATSALKDGSNVLVVLLENKEQSSRWYPGAGLYRKVRLVSKPQFSVPVWGTCVRTSAVSENSANVSVTTKIDGLNEGDDVTLKTVILDAEGNEVAACTDTRRIYSGLDQTQQLVVKNPKLWSPEQPNLYKAVTYVMTGGSVNTHWGQYPQRGRIDIQEGGEVCDVVQTSFGIRSIEFRPQQGFFLNGKRTMFKGVCLHHDLGPLGAAVHKDAIRHQLEMLKDMGCNAVRTSHNMPAEELVQLCDEMGIMLMLEPFDEWDTAKCENGYHRFYDQWWEKDMTNMLLHYRNNPSVVMWSIGNEVPSQWAEGGREVAAKLQDLCHRLDPTRPVTCGMDQFDAVMNNGFAAQLDIPGFNYKVDRYMQAYPLLPQGIILGSETASTVSSRGVYHFPVRVGADIITEDHQSGSYDTENCVWSNIPDWDFAADQDYPWMIGQFVWTGFDYLGEPSPYDTDAWPNHSSVFGIIDLASLPKDRYYLYRSIWNTASPTLHVLPHWNWKGREGEKTPVFVYTSYPSAELFVNGVSQGIRTKRAAYTLAPDCSELTMQRFRLMWDDVEYQPGELKVVAYDAQGNVADTEIVRTAGKPYALKAELASDPAGELVYVTVSVVDRNGVECPCQSNLVKVQVGGDASFLAIANGDPTCLESFQKPQMHLFSGKLTAIVRRGGDGPVAFKALSGGLKPCTLEIR